MSPFRWLLPAAVLAVAGACSGGDLSNGFDLVVVDTRGPFEPWGKSVGDINGDGLTDLVVGGHGGSRGTLWARALRHFGIETGRRGQLVWYENPTWEKRLIADGLPFATDHEVADVDADGHLDVVSLTSYELIWFAGPDWSAHVIDRRALHDLVIVDLDRDGHLDIVGRNQSRFGHNDGDRVHFYFQTADHQWEYSTRTVPNGEGLQREDMDGDGLEDIVVNGVWLENPGSSSETAHWVEHEFGYDWRWPDVKIDTGDVNGDGRVDIVHTPAEPEGRRYHMSWFEAPRTVEGIWNEHVIQEDVETVLHSVDLADFDGNGQLDLLVAETGPGQDPDEVVVYLNEGHGRAWKRLPVASTGSHNMRVLDVDLDGDPDFFGANWSGDHQDIELWVNNLPTEDPLSWVRHVVDEHRPQRATSVLTGDLNGDGLPDIASGGSWYQNPGSLDGSWSRRQIGDPASDVAILADFDSDEDLDVLASGWDGTVGTTLRQRILIKLGLRKETEHGGGNFVWARNNGVGIFEIMDTIPPTDGDFLQGAAVLDTGEVAVSWHQEGLGVSLLSVPQMPAVDRWSWDLISVHSLDEALTPFDIDGDGDTDIVQGSMWLRRNPGDRWDQLTISETARLPDRNRVADFNGDGRPDVAVGYEAVGRPGPVAWYEQGSDATSLWREHIVTYLIGPMSLDASDIDEDGDPDIVVGEHDPEDPSRCRLVWLENTDGVGESWRSHLVHRGDEHHDGARLSDLDLDGDLDIVSIGWSHGNVLVYENLGTSR